MAFEIFQHIASLYVGKRWWFNCQWNRLSSLQQKCAGLRAERLVNNPKRQGVTSRSQWPWLTPPRQSQNHTNFFLFILFFKIPVAWESEAPKLISTFRLFSTDTWNESFLVHFNLFISCPILSECGVHMEAFSTYWI